MLAIIQPNFSQMTPIEQPVIGASPFTYTNTLPGAVSILITGGTVVTIEQTRDGTTFYLVGILAGQFTLPSGDSIRLTYLVKPTMTVIPL